MRVDLTSFRFRIIATLIVVVSVFSSASIYTYNYFFINKLYDDSEKHIKEFLYFIKSEITNFHDGRLIRPMLMNLENDNNFVKVFLLDEDGNITFPPPHRIKEADTTNLARLLATGQEIQVTTSHSFKSPTSLALLEINNLPECYKCHDPEIKRLGYLGMNFTLADTSSTLAYSRVFSILYTIFVIIIIMVFVISLHVRFIKRSLSSFQHTIRSVNNGDLGIRVNIETARELANLGSSFNRMLDNFQKAQQELQIYHEKELESAEKLASIGEMAARLAHDVRNPLTGITNAIEIIAEEMNDSPNLPILKEIRRQTTRVNDAISNLLRFSRSVEIHREKGNINELISNIVFFLKTQKQNSKLEIGLITGEDVPEILFDAEMIENVLMNLCINAIQVMKYKGKINITTSLEQDGSMVSISVEDNGPGIPDDIKHEIFKPFYTTRTEGTGLGLAIAKETIDKHHGKIWFESTPGKGTVFYICLPVN